MVQSPEGWTISIHGSIRLHSSSGEVKLRPRERGVLAALALASPRSLSLLRLAELVWGLDIPRTYNKSLHNHVARIRQAADGVIETSADGYRLSDAVVIDRTRSDSPGVPFAELPDSVEVADHRAREMFLADQAEDARLIDLARRDQSEVAIGELRSAASASPLNETRWRLLARMLAHTGRRRDALLALTQAQDAFVAAGLDVGTELRDLERLIVDDDLALRGPVTLRDTAAEDEAPASSQRTIRIDACRAKVRPLLREAHGVSTIALTGPAGIGKTTMATAIHALGIEEGFAVYWTTCSAEPTVAFEPFTDLLRQGAERHPDELRRGDRAELLSSLVPEISADTAVASVQADRSALFDAIAVALRTDPRPAVMVIEDLHWASPFTLQLLAQCQQHRDEAAPPLVLVCTSRVELEHPPETTTSITIGRWSVDETADYLALLDPSPGVDAQRAKWIHRQTGGVALYVREMALAVLNDPAIVEDGRATDGDFPTLVAHLEAQRRELSGPAQRLVAAAAVLGRTFATSTLESMIEDAAQPLSEAVAAEFLLPVAGTDQHQFRHDLLHQVALSAVPPGSLAELHDLAVRSLEEAGGIDPGELARHALASADIDRARAVQHLIESAEKAADQYAYEEAISAYLSMRDLVAAESTQWCEATLAAGSLMARAGDERAQSFLRTAAETAGATADEDLVARSILELCRLGLTTTVGEVDEGVRVLLERALELVEEPGPRALTHTAGVGLYLVAGQPEVCRRHYLDAVEHAERSGDVDVLSNALGVTALALVGPDDLPRRRVAAAQLDQIGRDLASPAIRFSGLHHRMSNEVMSGDPNMRRTLVELAELAAVLRQRSRDWEVTNWQATVALIDGDLERSEAHATAALEYVDAVAESVVLAAYGAVMLGVRAAAGRSGEMIDPLTAALEMQPSFGAWHAALAFAAASSGDMELAQSHLDTVVADDCAVLIRDFTFSTALFFAGNAASLLNDARSARTIAELLRPWSGTWVWMGTATPGTADLVLARLAVIAGDMELARSRGEAALQQATRAEAPLHQAEATAMIRKLAE